MATPRPFLLEYELNGISEISEGAVKNAYPGGKVEIKVS